MALGRGEQATKRGRAAEWRARRRAEIAAKKRRQGQG
jgi:hypothetical protein